MAEPRDYIEPGSRWESKDWREKGRILEVASCAVGINPSVLLRTVTTPIIGARPETRMRAYNLQRRFRRLPAEVQLAKGQGRG